MGTEDWVLKGTKLMTNNKKQRLKIQSRGIDSQKHNIKKAKQKHKNYKNIYEVCFKNRVFFFCKVIVGYKNEN